MTLSTTGQWLNDVPHAPLHHFFILSFSFHQPPPGGGNGRPASHVSLVMEELTVEKRWKYSCWRCKQPQGWKKQTHQWRSVRTLWLMSCRRPRQRRINASSSHVYRRESRVAAVDAPKMFKLSEKIIHRCIIAAFPVRLCLLSSTFSLGSVFSSTAPAAKRCIFYLNCVQTPRWWM